MPNPMDMQAGFYRNGYYVDDETWDNASDLMHTYDTRPGQDSLENHMPSNSLVSDSQQDAVTKWAKENGYKLSSETLDYLYSQFFNEKNTASAWERTMQADNTKYQRAVEDLKKAGLNPFLLMSNGAGSSGAAQVGSVGSGSIAASKNADKAAASSIGGSILGMIGAIIAGIIVAMA